MTFATPFTCDLFKPVHANGDSSFESTWLHELPANVLVADLNLEICYANERARLEFLDVDSPIRRVPEFAEGQYLGVPIEYLHVRGLRAKRAIRRGDALECNLDLQGKELRVRFSGLRDTETGDLIGYLCLWELLPTVSDTDAARKMAALDDALPLAEFDGWGTCLSANRSFCELFALGNASFTGRHHSSLVDAREAESARYLALWQALRNGQPGSFKHHVETGSQSGLEVCLSLIPVGDEADNSLKVLALATNLVTDQAPT